MKLIRNLAGIFLLLLIADIARYAVYPDIGKLATVNPGKTAFMEYREAEWKKEGVDKKIMQRWVSLKKVSPALVKAVLIAEDDKFWKHEGFDYEAIEKAIERNIKEKQFKAGASTITQQLVKNLYLSPSKNPVRKLKEAILTWRIERELSKRRILELYVNIAEWGDGIFGIEEAAHHYYGTTAAGLTPYQSSRLASVLPNPIRFNPNGSSPYVASRSKRIYAIMQRRGITVPMFRDVMASPDSSSTGAGVDSIVIGVPDYLIKGAVEGDSSRSVSSQKPKPDNAPEGSLPQPRKEGE